MAFETSNLTLSDTLPTARPTAYPPPIATYWGSVFKYTQLTGFTSFKPYHLYMQQKFLLWNSPVVTSRQPSTVFKTLWIWRFQIRDIQPVFPLQFKLAYICFFSQRSQIN